MNLPKVTQTKLLSFVNDDSYSDLALVLIDEIGDSKESAEIRLGQIMGVRRVFRRFAELAKPELPAPQRKTAQDPDLAT